MSKQAGRRVGCDPSERGPLGRTLPVGFVLRLQQTVGNQEVLRLLAPPPAPFVPLAIQPVSGLQRGARWLGTALERLARRLRGNE